MSATEKPEPESGGTRKPGGTGKLGLGGPAAAKGLAAMAGLLTSVKSLISRFLTALLAKAPSGPPGEDPKPWRTYWVAIAFFAVAVVLAFDPAPFVSPVAARIPAPSWATDPAPVRQPRLKPEYAVAGFTYQCMECHRIIPSPGETLRTLTQHTEIQLHHGINTRCFNCHHPENRNAFVDDFGEEIAWNEPQLVCAKCHGPVYRDWQAGSHGRINGYWDPAKGPQTKRRCIECHDPHVPRFQGMAPAPGPNTLRMGEPKPGGPAHRRDPLRIHSQGEHAKSTH